MVYRICWESAMTGFTGCGEPMSLKLAKAWLKASENIPDIMHWIEQVI